MLFSVTKECFLKLFKLASFVVIEKKSGISIVGSHVLLSTKDNNITLTATDMDVELIVQESIGLVDEPGSAVVPFRKIAEICRAMAEKVVLNVSLEPLPSLKLNIKYLKGSFAINYLPADVFPVLSLKMFHTEFNISIKFFQDLISKVAFAMGDDEARSFLNGVFLSFSSEEIISVAADGHRLMIFNVDQKNNNEIFLNFRDLNLKEPLKLLIPRKSVFDILKITTDFSENVLAKISVGENHFRIEISNIIYTSKLLTASFPPYKKLIPQKAANVLTINREQLKNCLLRVVALLGDKSSGIKLKISENNLTIIGKNEQNDLAEESVSATFLGDPLEICFNLKYLLDFLSNVDTDTVLLNISNANSGSLIQDAALQSSYILMPMQL